jgi:uncharacterized protein (DUF1810 family)
MTAGATPSDDPSGLNRFLSAQEQVYRQAVEELRRGRKQSHWIWFVFPQIDGLGTSETTRHFAIRNLYQARAFLAHPVLGARLRECAEAVLQHAGRPVSDRVLDQFYGGERDNRTIALARASAG